MSTLAPPPPRRRIRLPRRAATSTLRPLDEAGAAPLISHIAELRMRVLAVAAFLLVAVVACYAQRDILFDLLAAPLDDRWPLQTLGVTEPFFTSLSISAQAGFVLTTPLIAYNAWRFVRPAIAPEARRTIAALLFVAPLLFTSGVVFAYFLVLGPAVQFLLGLSPDSIEVVVRASDYYSFVTTTLLAIGASFCFPLVVLGLARLGIVTSGLLARNRKIALVLMVVVAALLPTADPVSLAIEILPLLALYELSIVAVRVQERSMAKRAAAAATSDGDAEAAAP